MFNGIFHIRKPTNEPVLSYAPGTRERDELKAQLGDSKIDPIEGYALQLLAGGIVLAEVTMPTLVDDTFSEVALSYESVNSDPSGQALEIRIVEDGADKTSELYIDDVRLFKRQ